MYCFIIYSLYSCHLLSTDSFKKNRSFQLTQIFHNSANIRDISRFTPLFKKKNNIGIRFNPCNSNYLPSLKIRIYKWIETVSEMFLSTIKRVIKYPSSELNWSCTCISLTRGCLYTLRLVCTCKNLKIHVHVSVL